MCAWAKGRLHVVLEMNCRRMRRQARLLNRAAHHYSWRERQGQREQRHPLIERTNLLLNFLTLASIMATLSVAAGGE